MVCDMQASNAKKTALVLRYRPPSFDKEFFCTAMNNTPQAVHHEYDNVCVFGDFNFPSIDWSGNENTQNLGSCGRVSFKEIMSEFGHSQINDVISNSAGNILDLIFANIPEMISTVSKFPCIFPTDHAVLKLSIFIPKTRHNKKERFIYNYKAAQWNELRAKIVNLCKSCDWNKFKKLRKQLKKRMKHKYQICVEDLSDKVGTNPKTFWSFFFMIKLNLTPFLIL